MSKDKSPVQLFPRKEFEEKVITLVDGTVKDYIDTLLDAKNKIELDALKCHASLDQIIENSIGNKKTPIERLVALWDLWCGLTAEFSYIHFSPASTDPDKKVAATPRPKDSISKALGDLVDAIQERREIQSKVREHGYKYLPTWPTVLFVSEIPKITHELGFDPFSDLESYAESIDQILPKIPANTTYQNPSNIIKEHLFESGLLIAAKFAAAWNDSNQSLIKKFDAEDEPHAKRGVASLGRLIATSNLLTQIELLDESFLLKFQKEVLAILSSIQIEPLDDDEENESNPDDPSQEILGPIVKSIKDFEAIGFSEDVSKSLAVCHMLLMLRVMFCEAKNYDEIMEGTHAFTQLCSLAPFLTPGLRQALAELIVEEGYEDDELVNEGMQVIAFAFQPYAKTDNPYINESCRIFNKLNFRRRGISKSEFLELANLYLFTNSIEHDHLDAHQCTREFMAASQDLISWFYKTPEEYATPRLIQTLSSLRNFGNFGNISNTKHYDANPIWALSRILLDEDDFIDEKRGAFSRQSMIIAEVLLNKGMLAGASCVFNFLMVSESIRIAVDCHFISDKIEISYVEPFGDWAAFKSVTARLLDSGKKDVTLKAIRFAVEYLKETGVGNLNFAVAELSAYISNTREIQETNNAAEVIRLVQGKSNSIRERLIGLVGEETWNQLPSKIKGQVIQCEQVYDQSMGDQVLSGEPNYAWLTSYNTMIERMFKLKMAEMWSDPSLSRDLDASYTSGTKRAIPTPKFSLGSALYTCNGAAESGNRVVLNFLKTKGVDPYYVATKLSKDLFKAIRIRNKSTHAEDVTYEEASEARRIFLTRLPDVVKSLGIADADY